MKKSMPCNSLPTLLASFFGAGCIPVAPGTMGTLAAVPFVWLCTLGGWVIYSIITSIVIALGIWICGAAAKEIGVHDHGGIVWDEVAGMFITMLFIPISWQTLVLGFTLFRIFDIWKPWPISYLDKRVDGGVGIMLDDLVAGVFANLCLWIILLYIPF